MAGEAPPHDGLDLLAKHSKSESHKVDELATDNTVYKCLACKQSFFSDLLLESHVCVTRSCVVLLERATLSGLLAKAAMLKARREPPSRKPVRKRASCPICRRTLSCKSSLAEHMLIHTGERPHKCNICGQRFARKGTLTTHLRVHGGLKKMHPCSQCERAYTYKYDLMKHVRVKHFGQTYASQSSGQEHRNSGSLNVHVQPVSSGRSTCVTCKRSFATKAAMRRHARAHASKKPHFCARCNRVFAYKSHFLRHQRFHNSRKLYSCSSCSRSFALKSLLDSHILTHTGETKRNLPLGSPGIAKKPVQKGALGQSAMGEKSVSRNVKERAIGSTERHQCSTCVRSFASSFLLESHDCIAPNMMARFKCIRSDDLLAEASQLKAPLEAHRPGRKPASCSTCGRTFTRKSKLAIHMLIHTGERPHLCDFCGQGFSRKDTLKAHLNVHGGPKKQNRCSLCFQSFTFRSALLRHLRMKHGGATYTNQAKGKECRIRSSLSSPVGADLGISRPYPCTTCTRSFATRDALRRHAQAHASKKPHVCSVCDQVFAYKSHFLRHQSYHLNSLNHFSCPTCSQSFMRKTHLESHIRSHNADSGGILLGETEEGLPLQSLAMADEVVVPGERDLTVLNGKDDGYKAKELSTDSAAFPCSACNRSFASDPLLQSHACASRHGAAQLSPTAGSRPVAEASLPKTRLKAPSRSRKYVLCPTCGRTFTCRSSLSYHMKSHTGERPHLCDFCGQGFARRDTLKAHLNVHGGPKKQHRCSLCEAAYTFRGDLLKHLRAKHGGTTYASQAKVQECRGRRGPSTKVSTDRRSTSPYACATCRRLFATRAALRRHVQSHAWKKPRVCLLCNQTFTHKSHFLRHQRYHSDMQPFTCPTPGQAFSQKTHLKSNIRAHTGGTKRHLPLRLPGLENEAPPDEERDMSTTNEKFEKHMADKVPTATAQQYQCSTCCQSFATDLLLESHACASRLGAVQLSPTTGGRSIAEASLQETHLEAPSRSRKSVSCPTCGRTFASRSALFYHMRSHTGERPYVCDFCGQGFARKDTLKAHLNVHGGPKKQNRCSLCEAAYTFRGDLLKHVRAKHGGKTK